MPEDTVNVSRQEFEDILEHLREASEVIIRNTTATPDKPYTDASIGRRCMMKYQEYKGPKDDLGQKGPK